MEVLWTACDVYCKIHGFAMERPGCSPLQAVLEQDRDAKGPSWESLLLSHCLGQQREQALTQQLGVECLCVF